MLDSGGAYGRNFERNAGRTAEDFLARPEIYPISFGGLTLDLFHFLRKRVEIAPIDEGIGRAWDLFVRWVDSHGHGCEKWAEIQTAFLPWAESKLGVNVSREWGHNTANNEDLLSQVIQYDVLDVDGDSYVFLQIHGGCDIRGGYTAPRLFAIEDPFEMGDNAALEASYRVDPPQDETLPGMEYYPDPEWWNTYDGGYSWDPADSSARPLHFVEASEMNKDGVVDPHAITAIMGGDADRGPEVGPDFVEFPTVNGGRVMVTPRCIG